MIRTGGRVVKLAGVTITKIPFEKLSYFWKGAVPQGTQRNPLHTLLYCVDRLDAIVPVSLLSLTLLLSTSFFCRRHCCWGRFFFLDFWLELHQGGPWPLFSLHLVSEDEVCKVHVRWFSGVCLHASISRLPPFKLGLNSVKKSMSFHGVLVFGWVLAAVS
jgi:hypothetical protein